MHTLFYVYNSHVSFNTLSYTHIRLESNSINKKKNNKVPLPRLEKCKENDESLDKNKCVQKL